MRKLKPGGWGGSEKKGKVSELVHQAKWVHILKFKFSQHRAITHLTHLLLLQPLL